MQATKVAVRMKISKRINVCPPFIVSLWYYYTQSLAICQGVLKNFFRPPQKSLLDFFAIQMIAGVILMLFSIVGVVKSYNIETCFKSNDFDIVPAPLDERGPDDDFVFFCCAKELGQIYKTVVSFHDDFLTFVLSLVLLYVRR